MDRDKLGIGLKSRAKQFRRTQTTDRGRVSGMGAVGGPLQDPQWDGFFQAMAEQGVSGLRDDSAGYAKGIFDSLGQNYEPTFDPFMGQQSAVATAAPQVNKQGELEGLRIQSRKSRHLGAPTAFDALMRVR